MSATAFQRRRRELAEVVVPSLPTREDIDDMRKADVKEWLEAHGAETGGKVAELRDRLKAVMFSEI